MNYQINNTIDLYKEEDEWGYFIDIDNDDLRYCDNFDNYINNYSYKYNEENILKASNIIIKISSTTLLTIGVTYLILCIL
jgi:hypothetical protein